MTATGGVGYTEPIRPGGRRVESLDGLRGVAIILVLLFHGTVPGFGKAWLGVDIFFVLSGFLITTILVAEHDRQGAISLTGFYKRRALRLAPALFLMCGLFLLNALFLLPIKPARLRETLEALFYVSNWSQALNLQVAKYVGHTWSLGIEEQFYLIWPIILIAILAISRRKSAPFLTAAALALAAVFWRAWLWFDDAGSGRLYNGFDTRCDSLFVGCALAFVAPRLAAFWPLGVLGILGFLIFGRWNSPFMFLGGYTLLAISAALIIAGAVKAGTVCRRVLGILPLVAIGRISYGLYVFHFPVYAAIVDRVSWNPWYLNTIGLPIALALATVSYIYVERPSIALGRVPLGKGTDIGLALLGPVSLAMGAAFIAYFYFTFPPPPVTPANLVARSQSWPALSSALSGVPKGS